MPLPAVAEVTPSGSSVSGQTFVHPLPTVQVTLPPFSVVSMYRVWPLPLTRTTPTPGTALALTVMPDEEDAGADVLAGWLLPELTAALMDEAPQAATAATAPTTRLPYSSRKAGSRPGR